MWTLDSKVLLFFVEELSVLHIVVRVVTSEWVWHHLVVCVSEVDVPHVFSIMEHIWVQGVIVPEVVEIVLSLIMSNDHCS